MHSSPVKSIIALFAFLLLFGFCSASPLSTLNNTLPPPHVASRDDFPRDHPAWSPVYTEDLCNPNDCSNQGVCFTNDLPYLCYLVLYMEKLWVDPDFYNYWTYVYLFRASPSCKLIGYKSGVHLEYFWFSFDSELPYMVDIVTYGKVPQFKYADGWYDTDNTHFKFWQWTEKGVQGDDIVYRWPFNC